jgi:diguanylate cyclase (GGDEF)-like protein
VAARTRRIGLALKQAQRQVWLDPLTGLTSRRFLDEKLPEIFEAQREAGQELALVMMDLDHFKRFNDTFGHQAGDDLLRLAGQLLRGAVRDSDIAARYGGDEFLLMLPAVSAEQAAAVARRAVALFGQQMKARPARPAELGLGLSAGVASLRAHQPEDLQELVRLADSALYAAKRQGQSVCVARREVAQAVPNESS